MAVELPAHNVHNVLSQSSDDASILSGSDAGGLQATYVYITEALDGVKSIFENDMGLPKAEFSSKYTERYGEVSLRFMRNVLYSIVKCRKRLTLSNLIERKQTEGVKDKLVKDIYDILPLVSELKTFSLNSYYQQVGDNKKQHILSMTLTQEI